MQRTSEPFLALEASVALKTSEPSEPGEQSVTPAAPILKTTQTDAGSALTAVAQAATSRLASG